MMRKPTKKRKMKKNLKNPRLAQAAHGSMACKPHPGAGPSPVRSLFLFLLLFAFIIFVGRASAFPPIAAEFYGTAYYNGAPAQAGDVISAYTPLGVECGRFVVRRPGTYGFLSCNGDDPSTQKNEGAKSGDGIRFYINGKLASTMPSAVWSQGTTLNVSLTVGSAPGRETSTGSIPSSGTADGQGNQAANEFPSPPINAGKAPAAGASASTGSAAMFTAMWPIILLMGLLILSIFISAREARIK